jgi:hypothetical protein
VTATEIARLEALAKVTFPSTGELIEAFLALPKLLATVRVLRAELVKQSSSSTAA